MSPDEALSLTNSRDVAVHGGESRQATACYIASEQLRDAVKRANNG